MSGATTIKPSKVDARASLGLAGAKLYYLQLRSGLELGAELERIAGLGFGHVIIPPAYRCRMEEGRPLATDFAIGCDALGGGKVRDAISRLVAAASRFGLGVLMDVQLDRISADAAAAGDGPFRNKPILALDPRKAPDGSSAATAQLGSADDAEALAEFWSDKLLGWHSAGLAGFRLLGLADLPGPHASDLVAALRTRCPTAVLFAWTPGMSWDAIGRLAGSVDLVASSLPWWDWRSDWLWTELKLLRRIAPVVACAEAPHGPTLARTGPTPEDADAQHRLATQLAAIVADGWMALSRDDADTEAELLNELRAGADGAALRGLAARLSAAGEPVLALLRTDSPDARTGRRALIAVLNRDVHMPRAVHASRLLPQAGGMFAPFVAVLPPDGTALDPGSDILLAPGEARFYGAEMAAARHVLPLATEAAVQATQNGRLAIERPSPCVDGGRFPAKRTLGELVVVEADLIADGHDVLGAALRWRAAGELAWHETQMRPLGNDRWTAGFPLRSLGLHSYQIQVWRDAFGTFRDELAKKHAAGVPTGLEVREGTQLVEARAATAQGQVRAALDETVRVLSDASPEACRQSLLSDAVAVLMAQSDSRPHLVELERPVPVRAERTGAGYASWYEVFPRSMSDDPARHGTFADVERHLPRIREMGFDVLYFPPIHPIGRVNRKGRNNSLTPGPDDPGSPYAIGAAEGGHDALHPELGTFEDFERLRLRAAEHGLELAIDFAIQCSPDHPWLKAHKDWFSWRPDGSIRYAENPPKKYEDIVNVDFYAAGARPGLWIALCEAVLFWAARGVRLFRVDNPHTKPMPFWEWMIGEVQARYPDTVFLSEAFTRPKVMYRLAKVGFSQSYTYFTWRNTKAEFIDYLTELTQQEPRDFFRPHFFVNTPDINPFFLQHSGRAGFLIRSALATTLSGLWGVYNGFELCEASPMPGKEEYLDSEKYEIRAWDWDRPGNIVAEISRLNAIRKLNPALHSHLGVTFLRNDNDQILCFEKASPGRGNVLVVAISLDPVRAQQTTFDYAPAEAAVAYDVDDLLTDETMVWPPGSHSVILTPDRPYAIWRLLPVS